MSYLALNDTILPVAEAALPVSGEGVRYGSGCFETIAFKNGAPRFWQRHCERFIRSCVRLGVAPRVPPQRLRALADELALRNGITDGVLRLSAHQNGSAADTVLTLCPPRYAALPPAYRLGLSTVAHPGPGPFSGIKHNNYGHFLVAHAEVALRGYDEAILADASEKLLEGSRTNLFLLRGGANADPATGAGWLLQTAPLIRGVLPGVMRGLVLEAAGQSECKILEEAFDRQTAAGADALFVTNALIGIMPVVQLEDYSFAPGEAAALFLRRLQAAVDLLES